MLDIHADGSGFLQFGSTAGDGRRVPAGTVRPADVRKALDGVKPDPAGGLSSHFVFWYEGERKASGDGPPARYTRDAKVLLPLFETAAAAGKLRSSGRGKMLLKERPFTPR